MHQVGISHYLKNTYFH